MSRLPISATALIRPLTAKNQLPAAAVPATIVDITTTGLGLRLDPTTDVTPNRAIELGIDGHWTRGRITWSARGIHDAVIAGVELAHTTTVPLLVDAEECHAALVS